MHCDPYTLLGLEGRVVVVLGAESELQYLPYQCESAIVALPEALVDFEIRKCKTSIFGFLGLLIPEDGPCCLPNLKTVTLCFGVKEQPYLKESLLEHWKQRALRKGIAFKHIPVPGSASK